MVQSRWQSLPEIAPTSAHHLPWNQKPAHRDKQVNTPPKNPDNDKSSRGARLTVVRTTIQQRLILCCFLIRLPNKLIITGAWLPSGVCIRRGKTPPVPTICVNHCIHTKHQLVRTSFNWETLKTWILMLVCSFKWTVTESVMKAGPW